MMVLVLSPENWSSSPRLMVSSMTLAAPSSVKGDDLAKGETFARKFFGAQRTTVVGNVVSECFSCTERLAHRTMVN